MTEQRPNEARARDFLATAESVRDTTPYELMWRFRIGRYRIAEKLLLGERLKRGDITFADLTPPQRRMMIDPKSLDLHALAAGPIMEPNEIYLPAGKLSMAETRAREASMILPGEPHHERDEA